MGHSRKKNRGVDLMVRLQDIADMVGVSRTTVSNVLHGKTKRVSKENIDRISAILKEINYVPNMGANLINKGMSRIVIIVIGYEKSHGYKVMEDPFISTLLGNLQKIIKQEGYYMMIVTGDDKNEIIDMASRWSIDGMITIGIGEKDHLYLRKHLNKPTVSIDTYTQDKKLVNVVTDDFYGGYIMGNYLHGRGLHDTLYMSEHTINADAYRWKGFQKAMTQAGVPCDESRWIIVPSDIDMRLNLYKKIVGKFLKKKALFFAADFLAIEAINFFRDQGIRVPQEISVCGFDDHMFSTFVRPQLTTVHQNIEEKAVQAFEQLIRLIENKKIPQRNIKIPVSLIIRDSVI